MKAHKQFSLIEVLIILVVVSILSGLIFHASSVAREKAKMSTCLNNLKQIQTVYEVFRKDHRTTPYNPLANSSKEFGDFTFAEKYVNEDSLDSFVCPGDNEASVFSHADLDGKTSYNYIPSLEDVEDMEDMNASNLLRTKGDYELAATDSSTPVVRIDDQYLIIYDKSRDSHKGFVNIVYLHGSGNNQAGIARTMAPDDYEWPGVGSEGDPSGNTEGDGKVKNNNGHGNNVDGVDSSNKGNSKEGEDESIEDGVYIDDEKKNGKDK